MLTDWIGDMGKKYIQLGRAQLAVELLEMIKAWARKGEPVSTIPILLSDLLALSQQELAKLHQLTLEDKLTLPKEGVSL